MKVFVFTWNVASCRYTPEADFIEPLLSQTEGYDIIIIGLQEDSIRDSILLKDLFPKKLTERGYKLLDAIELSGWGVTTYKALKNNWEYLPRGLRLAVFVKNELDFKTVSASYVCPSIKDKITWGKGAVVIVISNETTKLAIVNVHLPFSSKSLHSQKERNKAVEYQEYCLQTLLTTIERFSANNLILLGDFNFRVCPWDFTDIPFGYTKCEWITNDMVSGNFVKYLEYDELTKSDIYKNFSEGVDGIGPEFLPTCKLLKNRVSPSFKLGKNFQRYPSWCDRILVKNLECIGYSRFDFGEMNLSDHAGVIGKLIF